MQSVKTYQVTCSQCGAARQVKIANSALGARIDWQDDGSPQSIVSFRERTDGVWGWQCVCGCNDLMTTQERQVIEDPTAPKPQEIKQIVDNLVIQSPKFNVVEL